MTGRSAQDRLESKLLSHTKVAFDREAFLMQTSGGVSRYYSNLIKEFLQDPGLNIDPALLFRVAGNTHLADLDIAGVTHSPLATVHAMAVKAFRHQPSDRLRDLGLSVLGGGGSARSIYDVVHLTHFLPLEKDVQSGTRVAITVHDMIWEVRPSDSNQRNPHPRKKELAQSADLVFCVSRTTADLVNEVYGKIRGTVVTVPHGVDSAIFRPPTTPQPNVLGRPYVLYVGSRSWYKNFGVLLEALSILRKRGCDLGLVLAGGGILRIKERRRIAQVMSSREFLHCFPSDLELASLYSGAATFCFPSLQEGFGIPILEAMASGCPAVISDIPVFHEVGGDAAEYFEPSSAESLAHKISIVLEDSERRKNLQYNGLQRAGTFTWHNTAKLVSQAYENVI
jgi:glycosyltransferase involved in cell wall biosynthesis